MGVGRWTSWSCAANADAIGGRCCENCHAGPVVADDGAIMPMSEGVRGHPLDPERAEALWRRAEAMTGERSDLTPAPA